LFDTSPTHHISLPNTTLIPSPTDTSQNPNSPLASPIVLPTTQHNHIDFAHDLNQPIILLPPLPPSLPIRHSRRTIKQPTYRQVYHCSLFNNLNHDSSTDTSKSSSTNKYLISSFLSYKNISFTNKHFLFNLPTISEPSCYEKVICDDNWNSAIKAKLTALV
jgi:hypothetical protein